ncbi:MAG: ATP-grasp domain-containing protein [Paludibacteraceae bacterium]|nr:ATP-grasp domain-containing protein [Paludibacteraceae bacterium]
MSNSKTILILGGGYYNVPLIKKSVELGYYTLVCGINGDYPGYQYADKWIDVDITNKDGVLEIVKKYNVNGVISTGSDFVLPTIGYLVDNYGLIGPTEQAAFLSTNKYAMKQSFLKHNVRTAPYKKVSSFGEACCFVVDYGYPVVLKVVDACGGRGIAIIHNENELQKYYEIVEKETKLDYLIIEKFIKGEEFGAQAYVRNGELTFVMPHGDIVYHGLTDVPIGHYAPYERADELKNDIEEQLTLCVKALGIDNTAINADFILSSGKVFVLEIGARAGATCLPELVSCHYDVDYYEYLLRMSVGEEMMFPEKPKYASFVETLQTQQNGIVKEIKILVMPKEVQSFNLYPKVGDVVRPFRNAYDRIGTLVMRGEKLSELRTIRGRIVKGIKISTK